MAKDKDKNNPPKGRPSKRGQSIGGQQPEVPESNDSLKGSAEEAPHPSEDVSSVERIRRGHEDRSRARRKTLKHRSRAKFSTGVEADIDRSGLEFLRVIRSEGAYLICQAKDNSLLKE